MASNLLKGSIFGPMGTMVGGAMDLNKKHQQSRTGADMSGSDRAMAEMKALRDAQIGQAQAFRKNTGGYKVDLGTQMGESKRSELARNMADIRRGAQSRGMLYSGMRAGQEAGAQQQTAGQLASGTADINRDLEAQARQQEMAAAQTGLAVNQMENDRAAEAYQRALLERKDKMAMYGMAGKGLGGFAGGLAGSA